MAKKRAPAGAKPTAGNPWNLNEIRELMDLLDERQISEFEMEKSGIRIRIKRGESLEIPIATVLSPPPRRSAPHSEVTEAPAGPVKASSPEPAEPPEDLHLVKSPIVGTYYGSPSPSAPPFVKAGDEVAVGEALCIIEAMKLMNEIESDVAGEVVRVYVENGQPVEYGQPLFAIRPSHKK